MLLGIFRTIVCRAIFAFLHFSRTQKGRFCWLKCLILTKKKLFFTLFGCDKNAKIKNRSAYVSFKYAKEHFYQFLDQLDHFPETSFKFSAKSGYAWPGPQKRRFSAIKYKFFGKFFQNFGIDKNHLIILYYQISDQLKHFLAPKMAIFM